MRNAKRKYWKKYKILFGFILFVIGFMVFSCVGSFDIFTGVGLALIPALVWIEKGQFTQELTQEEYIKLTAEEKALYLKEFNESIWNSYSKDLEEKLKNFIDKDTFDSIKKITEQMNKNITDQNFKAQIEELKAAFNSFSKNSEAAIAAKEIEGMSKFAIMLTKTKTNQGKNTKDGISLKDALKNHQDGDRYSFTIKATFTGADVTQATLHAGGQIIPGIGQLASGKFVLSSLFKVSPIQIDGNGSAVYEDWDEATSVRAAAALAEEGTYASSTAKFKTYSLTIEKIGDSISMSYEAIRDFNRFVRELARFITRNVLRVVNQALWNGSGVTPNIAGIYTRTTAFVPGTYTGATTTTPDIVDLIKVLKKQIMSGADDKYNVNFSLISWEEYLEASLVKDTVGRLIYPNGIDNVAGVQVIPTSYVSDNQMVIGDKEYVEMIGDPEAIEVEMGLKSGDWETDKESIKARVRTALLIRQADLGGFLKVTDIDAAIVAITT